ncbi:MAG: hypothetical protein B7X53_17460 [Hyphomonas sp. 34-62-18]|nr:hypothetical protein [Hyphomonas sp. 34-62-18]OZB12801.1 MAG: hypothetical protein B7X53_17460 [Hyphomonas sp. 34-62-18]
MDAYIPLIVSALGGTLLGPVVARLLGGGGLVGVVGGVLGGVAAHYGAEAGGIGQLLGSSPMMVHLQNFIEGGIGGGVFGLLAGLAVKKR